MTTIAYPPKECGFIVREKSRSYHCTLPFAHEGECGEKRTTTCSLCGHEVQIGEWPLCPHGFGHGNLSPLGMHHSEVTVVYEHPGTGKIRYPGRADKPMPERYAKQG